MLGYVLYSELIGLTIGLARFKGVLSFVSGYYILQYNCNPNSVRVRGKTVEGFHFYVGVSNFVKPCILLCSAYRLIAWSLCVRKLITSVRSTAYSMRNQQGPDFGSGYKFTQIQNIRRMSNLFGTKNFICSYTHLWSYLQGNIRVI